MYILNFEFIYLLTIYMSDDEVYEYEIQQKTNLYGNILNSSVFNEIL